jgi:hypothetical protein
LVRSSPPASAVAEAFSTSLSSTGFVIIIIIDIVVVALFASHRIDRLID